MSDNWVVQNLENALETWNEKLAEIWQLITTTPQDFKGGGIWGVIVNINGAVQSIGLALLVLFFVAGMVKTCGSFTEVKKPEHALKLFVRFAIAKGAITYGTVTFGSNKIVWWKGACGHEWQTSIKARSAGEQCPICSGARVLRGYNDFESKFPELAKEWSPKNEPLRPSMITAATHRKVIWQCKLGHEWTASVKSRTVNGTGCPYCSHNFVLPGFNDLASRFPEIAKEWSERNLPLTPDQVTAFKNIKVWWKCHLGHEWNTLISTRAGGSQCPYCSGIKLLKGFNDLKTKYPSLAIEWSDKNLPLTPDRITYGSNKVVWWKGACGHEWQTSVKARSNGENCPICSGARVIEGINDLATLKPELADEWSSKNDPLKPTMVTTGSHKKVIWQDKYGHEWTATVKSRALNGTGCPYCSHNKILVGFNDLASQRPQIASEWSERNYPLKPDMVTVFANRKVWWRCSKGHEWNTLISTRSGGSGCPYCSGQLLLKGFNDFATTHPQLAQEWSDRNLPLAPDMINEKSRRNVWWKCRECGYEWQSVVYARVKGTVCPVCADRAVMAGYNDLATTDAHLLSEWDYEKNKNISPNKISRHSMQSVWWKCSLGHSWKAKISERAIEGKGCKVCEKDYLTVFPKLAVMYYAAKKRIKVQTDTDKIIGIPLEIYLPEEKAAIETVSRTENVETLKAYLCRKREIKLIKIPYTLGNSEIDFAMKIKKAFRSLHIFITSNEDEDTAFIRQRFFEWRKGQIK